MASRARRCRPASAGLRRSISRLITQSGTQAVRELATRSMPPASCSWTTFKLVARLVEPVRAGLVHHTHGQQLEAEGPVGIDGRLQLLAAHHHRPGRVADLGQLGPELLRGELALHRRIEGLHLPLFAGQAAHLVHLLVGQYLRLGRLRRLVLRRLGSLGLRGGRSCASEARPACSASGCRASPRGRRAPFSGPLPMRAHHLVLGPFLLDRLGHQVGPAVPLQQGPPVPSGPYLPLGPPVGEGVRIAFGGCLRCPDSNDSRIRACFVAARPMYVSFDAGHPVCPVRPVRRLPGIRWRRPGGRAWSPTSSPGMSKSVAVAT